MTGHEEIVFGVPMHVDPDMPPGQVTMGLHDVLRALAGPAAPPKHPVTTPCPEGLDPVKWAQLDRKTRRALVRHHSRITRGKR